MSTQQTRMSRTLLVALMVALASSACSDAGRQAAVDSDLARDIALVNRTPAVPQLTDTALSTKQPQARRPTPPTPAPKRVTRQGQPRGTVTGHERTKPLQPEP